MNVRANRLEIVQEGLRLLTDWTSDIHESECGMSSSDSTKLLKLLALLAKWYSDLESFHEGCVVSSSLSGLGRFRSCGLPSFTEGFLGQKFLERTSVTEIGELLAGLSQKDKTLTYSDRLVTVNHCGSQICI